MKRIMVVVLVMCVVMITSIVGAQQPSSADASRRPNDTEDLQKENNRLRNEIDRLRKERDAYRGDLDRAGVSASDSLKALSGQLSKEIKEDFYGSVLRILWIIGILAGVATAGGFWKLSDIITARVNEKVDKEKEALQRLSDKLFDDLAELKVNVAQKERELEGLSQQMRIELEAFSRQADEHRRKVETVSEQIVTEMQSRVLEVSAIVDASGRQSTVITQAEPTPATGLMDAGLPLGVTRIFPASPGQYASESLIHGKYYGSFAYYFTKALLDPAADKDGDGKVSLQEAVLTAKKSLKTSGFLQDPFIRGPAASISLFSLRKVTNNERPSGKLLALLIGINEYSEEVPRLQGAVNDVSHLQKLIENRSRLLAEEAECHTLTDKEATRSRIVEETQWLHASATSNDIVLFFFSGHGTSIPDANNKKKKDQILVPHDPGNNLENAIHVATLMEQLSSIRSRATIFITG